MFELGAYIFNLNQQSLQSIISYEKNIFWREVIDSWAALSECCGEEINEQTVLKQPLWLNKGIKRHMGSLFCKNLYDAGIVFINDLVDANGAFLSYHDAMEKYDFNLEFSNYNDVLDAIPNDWKILILSRGNNEPHDTQTNLIKLIRNCTKACNCSYKIMIEKYSSIPSEKQNTWKCYLESEDLQWDNIYKNCFRTFEEVKLRQFQYFFVQRITALNPYLFKCHLCDTVLCSFCNSERETIEHFFWTCPLSSHIWSFVDSWLRANNFYLPLTRTNAFFGIPNPVLPHEFLANKIFILCKCYLYACKHSSQIPTTIGVKFYLRHKYLIEKTSVHFGMSFQQFYSIWGELGTVLENLDL